MSLTHDFECNLWSLKNLRVLIYPKLQGQNHVITCHDNIHAKNLTCFSSFTSHRLSKVPQFPPTIDNVDQDWSKF